MPSGDNAIPGRQGFQTTDHPDTGLDVNLDSAEPAGPAMVRRPRPPLVKTGNGEWTVLDTVAESVAVNAEVKRVVYHLNGQPHVKVVSKAAAAIYDEPDAIRSEVNALCDSNSPMTALFAGASTGSVIAVEGRGTRDVDENPVLLSKGSRTKGRLLNKSMPVGVASGYGRQDWVSANFRDTLDMVPIVERATFDGIPEYGQAPSPATITAIYLLDYPDFNGGTVPGCMFLATDQDCEAEIVDGYLWAPNESALTSEHGSQYRRDIERLGGRVVDYKPGSLTFQQCVRGDLPPSRIEAYRAILGHSFYQE